MYLLDPQDQVLRMVVVTGVSEVIATPWSRVALAAPVPVAEAARECQLVWLSSNEELARRYPRTALAFPYHIAMCVAPLDTGAAGCGVVLLLWPGTRSAKLSGQEEREITAAGRRMGRLVQQAADNGDPIQAETELRRLDQSPPPEREETEAQAAVALTERLEEGLCALDLDGRLTFLNSKAAELLGGTRQSLLGSHPLHVLPWLDDPAHENAYLAALFTRLPTSFTALRPPDHWLSFRFLPDITGVSVSISPTDAPPGSADAPAGSTDAPAGSNVPPLAPPSGPASAGALFYLLHLGSALTTAVGVEDVTQSVTDQIMPVVNAQGLALLTADEGRLQVLSSHGFPREDVDTLDNYLMRSDTASSRVIETGHPAFFPDNKELLRLYPNISLYRKMAAFSYLPLIASGRIIGCCVLGYDRPHTFTMEERAALTSLAGMIAQALERARLYDTKSQVARGLQAALLPHALPQVPGLDVAARYLPATQGMDIGGDFYDFIRFDATTVAAVIGDVQGHNVSAAALMGQLRTAVRSQASVGTPPEEVLARTNRLLTDLNSHLFASCLYAQLDLRNGTAYLSTAGHLPPILRHPDGRTEILDLPAGLVLGVEPDAEYVTTEVQLPPGAVLTFYTDGLIERPSTDLGDAIDELADELAGADPMALDRLADALIGRARLAAQGNDDIALLLISPQKRKWDGEAV
ncbi:SpoIIE family protein phosphatase [Streptomyces sp. NPDC102274]|uniref:SpoIIE family protein phosphatase n=1 Tax=Streptomyces sp. NPDC102274 TaxID=3366151 RepID=UPI0038051CB3